MDSKPAVIQASFANIKFMASRKVVQLVFEIPFEMADDAYQVLGFPDENEGKYVAIAPLAL